MTSSIGSMMSDLLWIAGIPVFSLEWVMDIGSKFMDHTFPLCFSTIIHWFIILAALFQSSQFSFLLHILMTVLGLQLVEVWLFFFIC